MATEHERKYIALTKLLDGKVDILYTGKDEQKRMVLCVASEDEVATKEIVKKSDPDLLSLLVFKPRSVADGFIRIGSTQGAAQIVDGKAWPMPTIYMLE